MIKRNLLTLFVLIFLCLNLSAQKETIPFAKQATKENRAKEYRSLISNINSNLFLSLTDSTEENWQDAFDAMLLLNNTTPFINARIHSAMDSVAYRSIPFQKAMLQLVYGLYPKDFVPQASCWRPSAC